MNKSIIVGIIIVIVVIVGGWWIFAQNNKAPVTENATTPSNQTSTINNPDQTNHAPAETTSKNYDVIYTDAGYSPSTLTIKVGDTVTFKNQSSGGMWTASASHPSHTAYSGTSVQQHCPDPNNASFDECKADASGTSWSFTFNKAGDWGYHNHVNAKHFGKIIVQ